MRCYDNCEHEGKDTSLLFFFLILVMIFCRPGIVGCGRDEDCGCGCEQEHDHCQCEHEHECECECE